MKFERALYSKVVSATDYDISKKILFRGNTETCAQIGKLVTVFGDYGEKIIKILSFLKVRKID